jgi:hypothetical protein
LPKGENKEPDEDSKHPLQRIKLAKGAEDLTEVDLLACELPAAQKALCSNSKGK